MTKHRINKEMTSRARSIRSNMTDVERLLWRSIRAKQIYGYRFRRQYPIGYYIVDFACLDKKWVIELDGGQHQDQVAYDERRTLFLQAQGWQVLRFWNNDVLVNLDGVLFTIADALNTLPPS